MQPTSQEDLTDLGIKREEPDWDNVLYPDGPGAALALPHAAEDAMDPFTSAPDLDDIASSVQAQIEERVYRQYEVELRSLHAEREALLKEASEVHDLRTKNQTLLNEILELRKSQAAGEASLLQALLLKSYNVPCFNDAPQDLNDGLVALTALFAEDACFFPPHTWCGRAKRYCVLRMRGGARLGKWLDERWPLNALTAIQFCCLSTVTMRHRSDK